MERMKEGGTEREKLEERKEETKKGRKEEVRCVVKTLLFFVLYSCS